MTVTEDTELRSGPSLDDIREWGRQNGYDVPATGRLPKGLRPAYNEAHGMEPRATAVHGETVEERAPQIKRESLTERVRGAVTRTSKPAPRGKAKIKKPRAPIEGVVEFLWGVMADMAKPINPSVSRVLTLQAPVAGMVLEENMRGKIVDRVLQPFARAEEGAKVWGALFGPPALVALITKYPGTADKAIPQLRKSLQWWLDVAGPQIEKKIKQEEEFEAVYGQRVDEMIVSFFPDWTFVDDTNPNAG